jgi:hypothetical protein
MPTFIVVLLFYLPYSIHVSGRRILERQVHIYKMLIGHIVDLFTPRLMDFRDKRLELFCKRTQELDQYLLDKNQLDNFFALTRLLTDYHSEDRPL